MWRSSSPTPNSSQVTELLMLSQKVCPATRWRKFNLFTFIHNFILSVMTKNSWTPVKVRSKSTSKPKVFFLSASLILTTDQYSKHITADAAPIRLSILCSTFLSFKSKILRYLNSSTRGQVSPLIRRRQATRFFSDMESINITSPVKGLECAKSAKSYLI